MSNLPWLKGHRIAGTIMASRKAEGGLVDEGVEGEHDPLHDCMEDLHKAMKAGNIEDMSEAMRAAFQILDSEPHEEGEHLGEDE